MNLFLIFLTGLTTGGLACLAVQGGLLTSVIANQKDRERDELLGDKQNLKIKKKEKYLQSLRKSNFVFNSFDQLDWLPVGMFLVAKLISHIILGFLLGFLGARLTLSLELRLGFQIFTALFMFATAMNLLDVHPIFRYVVFQPPKFLQKMIRNRSKSTALFSPAILGMMTVFIPCGVTQAMEVVAINSGNPILGALIMGSFVLGTMPLFALIGVATAKLSEGWYQTFSKVASYALIIMTIYSVNGVMVVLNSPITLNKLVSPITYFFSDERFSSASSESQTTVAKNGEQQITIQVQNNGYSPNYFSVKKGVPVNLTLQSNGVYSCALSFVFPEFGIKTFLESTDSKSFVFTPQRSGRYTFTCSMGMYTGIMEVI